MKKSLLSMIMVALLAGYAMSANLFGNLLKEAFPSGNAYVWNSGSLVDTLKTADTLFLGSVADTSSRRFVSVSGLETDARATPDSIITLAMVQSRDADACLIALGFRVGNNATNTYYAQLTPPTGDSLSVAIGATQILRYARPYYKGASYLAFLYHGAATDNVKVVWVRQYLKYPGKL